MSAPASSSAVVIGAGIAGTATALALQTAGFRTTLIDRHEPAWGASGRNAGFLWLQTKAAGLSMDFSQAARAFAEPFASPRPEAAFRASGGMILWRDEELAPVVEAFVADRQAAGLPVQALDRQAVRDLCPEVGPQVRGAVWNPMDAHQDTGQLTRALVRELEEAGGCFRQGAAETLILQGGCCGGVQLEGGERLEADLTILAAGPWSARLSAPAGLHLAYSPMRFEAAMTEPATFRIGPVMAGQALFRFFVPGRTDPATLPRDPTERLWPELGFTEQIASRADGAVMFGCAYEAGSDDDRPTVAGQAMANAILSRNIPALARLRLVSSWAGIVAVTPDGLPVIEADTGVPGLALNCGHFFGNLAGTFSARLLVDALTGKTPAFPLAGFSHRRFSQC